MEIQRFSYRTGVGSKHPLRQIISVPIVLLESIGHLSKQTFEDSDSCTLFWIEHFSKH